MEKCILGNNGKPSCPNLQRAIENYPEDSHPEVATREILRLCAKSYECEGPREVITEVAVDGIRGQAETQKIICGLE